MRGHEHLLRMRRERLVPDIVWLDTDPCGLRSWEDWPDLDERHARIWIEPHELPDAHELFFLIGLVVHVSGTNELRVEVVAEAATAARAKRVIVGLRELA